jgi:hypothetical protein
VFSYPQGEAKVTTKICTSWALVLGLSIWTLGQAEAGPRCYPKTRFVVSTDGLVTDTLTNLVWQQQVSSGQMTWAKATNHCSSGFRLPTIKELTSIVDLTVTSGPTIDQTAFPGTAASYFWTSSQWAGDPGYAWSVSFDSSEDGGVVDLPMGSIAWVRCVR